jgi:hypothetical protein
LAQKIILFWIIYPTEDTLRTDSTFCGDMAIWEQETGVLYQIVVYGGQGENIQTHLDCNLQSHAIV